MIPEDIGVEAQLAVQSWRDARNREENPDFKHADLSPALSRLLGWLAEGEKCEQKGMRVVALLVCVRPDFIEERSFRQMSRASKRICDELIDDFKKTFAWRDREK